MPESPDLNAPEDENHVVRMSRADVRALEESGRTAEADRAEAAQLRRDLAFARAGIDTSSPGGAIFARGYDGELEADQIRASAALLNLGTPAATAPPSDPAPANPTLAEGEANLTDERNALANGAVSTGTPPAEDAYDKALRIGQEELRRGAKREEALGTAFASVVNAAQNGDRSVLVNGRDDATA